MSGSIGETSTQPLVPVQQAASHIVQGPHPSGPPTSLPSVTVSASGATSSTANPDGSLTTLVTDVRGNTLSVTTNDPAPAAIAAAHPLVSFEA